MLTLPTRISLKYPKTVALFFLAVSLILASQLLHIKIDTDPENMLERTEPVRVFYDKVKTDFGINDMIVVGIVNNDGVFNRRTLENMDKLVSHLKAVPGVIFEDVVSFSTSDTIEAGGGFLSIHPIMEEIPSNGAEMSALKELVMSNPMLRGKLASEDGKGVAIYVPIEKKDMSFRIASDIERFIEKLVEEGGDEYYIAGLPVAEDTFGHDMFVQMGIGAPAAMAVIFLLMLYFFKRPSLVTFAMLVAMTSVFITMGLLVGMGFTVHIMSSMIPIFLMPISVIDSVHILSDFHDTYQKTGDRKKTIEEITGHLARPMLFTSITSAVGFASLATTPIPPVKVFGLFVSFGIIVAWFTTVTLIPALIMLVNEEKLKKAFSGGQRQSEEERGGVLHKLMAATLSFSAGRSRMIGVTILLSGIISAVGISMIEINDNPVHWFKKEQKIAVADRVMNAHFSGTYMANLIFSSKETGEMKSPVVAEYISELQSFLHTLPAVGMTTGYTDVIKRVNHAIHDFNASDNVIPKNREELAQYLFLFLNSGDPEDLAKLVDFDYTSANLWIQLKSGDNQDMIGVINRVSQFMDKNPLPAGLTAEWAGLTYLNVIWQEKMVKGMMNALISSFVIVFILMTFLFRSLKYGTLAMIPLSVTIAVCYGFLGLVGKSYDMPVAVLSSLALGLSVDFAIHFLEQYLEYRRAGSDTREALKKVFEAPARAIFRNAVVISIGFTPLLFAPLVPYITVGVLMASIMVLSTIATLVFLPALLTIWPDKQKETLS